MANQLDSSGLNITSGDVKIPEAKLSTSRQILRVGGGKTVTIKSPYTFTSGFGFNTNDVIRLTCVLSGIGYSEGILEYKYNGPTSYAPVLPKVTATADVYSVSGTCSDGETTIITLGSSVTMYIEYTPSVTSVTVS